MHEKILNLLIQKFFSKNTKGGSAALRAFLIKAHRHKHLNMGVLLEQNYGKGQVA